MNHHKGSVDSIMLVLARSIMVVVANLWAASGSKLVDEQLNVFQRILTEGFGKDKLDVDGVVQLMHLMEGHPRYNLAGFNYVAEKMGSLEIPFTYLHELVNKIYGDQISDDPFQPQELHLGYTNDPTSMKIMWVTIENLEKPFVQFIPEIVDNWKLATSSPAVNFTYTVPVKWWPVFTGVIYEVDMTGLEPEKRYKYRVGGYDNVNQTMRYSDTFTFQAAPSPNPSHTTRVFTGADHGTFELLGFETVKKMIKVLPELRPDFTFIAGDLSYAGIDTEFKPLDIEKDDEFEHIWDLLGIQNQPIASVIPWMVGVGNHEAFYNFTAVNARYKMPQTEVLGTQENFWYTFTYGNIQWVAISSEHDLSEGSPQMTFIHAALTAAVANRANVPWIILSIHKPLYCSAEGSPTQFASKLDSVLLQYDVDLTISGHMHAMERIHPVQAGEVMVYPVKQTNMHTEIDETAKKYSKSTLGESVDVYYSQGKGPVHVMQGHAGAFQLERWIQPAPAWSAFRMANGFIPKNDSTEDNAAHWLAAHDFVVDFTDETPLTYTQLKDLPMFAPKPAVSLNYNYSHTFGFGFITAKNASHLHYIAIPNVEGIVNHDEFWIVKRQ